MSTLHSTFSLAAFDPLLWLDYPIIRLGATSLTVLIIVKVVLWIAAVLVANLLIRRLVLRRLLARTHFGPGLRFAITKMFGYAFVTLGFYVVLVVNGVNLSSLAVVAGALGIGVGFGLQNIVGNFVSGLVLLAERPVAVGDSALNFELAVWTEEMTHSPRRFRSNLNYAIERALREAGIEIPFPQRVVQLRAPPHSPPSQLPPAFHEKTN